MKNIIISMIDSNREFLTEISPFDKVLPNILHRDILFIVVIGFSSSLVTALITSHFPTSPLLKSAINEIISPAYFNVSGLLGILCLFTAIFTGIERFARSAHKLLTLTYKLAFLVLGIALGEITWLSYSNPSWGLTIFSLCLVASIIFVSTAILLAAIIADGHQDGRNFTVILKKSTWSFRIIVGVPGILMILSLLLASPF